MKVRIYFRFDTERPPSARKADIKHALSISDAENVVRYRYARFGQKIVIIKSFQVDREFYPKRHDVIVRSLK